MHEAKSFFRLFVTVRGIDFSRRADSLKFYFRGVVEGMQAIGFMVYFLRAVDIQNKNIVVCIAIRSRAPCNLKKKVFNTSTTSTDARSVFS